MHILVRTITGLSCEVSDASTVSDVQSQVEKKLKEGGINITELNRKLNIALFGDKSAKYYKFKGEGQK